LPTNLIIDSLLLIITSAYYALVWLVLHIPQQDMPNLNILALVMDVTILAVPIYRIWEYKKSSLVLTAMMIMPFFSICHFFLNLSALSKYVGYLDLLLFAALWGVYFYYIYRIVLFGQGPTRKIIKERGNPKLLEPPGKNALWLNNEYYIPEHSRFSHMQVMGSTGSGKTRFIFFPGIAVDIKRGSGVFIYDIKGNMDDKIEEFVVWARRDMDYYCFNLGEKQKDKGKVSRTYNPLAGDDADEITNRIFVALYSEDVNANTFYEQSAEAFLRSAIRLLMKKFKTIVFRDLYKIILDPKKYLQPICNEYKNNLDSVYLLDAIKEPKFKEQMKGLFNKISKFATSKWADQINVMEPEINISEIISKNKVLLFQANAGSFGADYKAMSILIMMHIQSEIAKRLFNVPEKPFYIYLDEFSNIIYKGFKELINKAREAKVGIIFGHQALGDIGQCGPEIKNIILTNSINKVFFKNDDDESVKYFSSVLGTQTIERRVESFSTAGGVVTPAGFTKKEEQEYVIHPDDLRNILLGEGVIKIDTIHGRIIKKIDFEDMPKNLNKGVPLYKFKSDPIKNKASDNFEVIEKEIEKEPEENIEQDEPEESKESEGFITIKDLRDRAKKDKNKKKGKDKGKKKDKDTDEEEDENEDENNNKDKNEEDDKEDTED
jgi:type IV secretory pathway TraG/TraD family ATPase VirD4